jgi:hypothetical protein
MTFLFAGLSWRTFAQSSQKQSTTAKPAAAPVRLAEKPIPLFHVWQQREGVASEIQVTQIQLNPGGYWVLVYLDRHARGTDAMLKQLDALATTAILNKAGATQLDPARLVLVVGHVSGAQLSAMELEHPALSAAAWTHDEHGAAAAELQVRGVPHIFGMHAGLQRWQFAGELRDTDLQPMVTTWMSYNSLAPGAMHRSKAQVPMPKATDKPAPQGAK